MNMEKENSEEVLNENSVQVVEFILQGQSFAIDIQKVIEIQNIPEITPVFHCPDIVVGVVNIRGDILALLDIGIFFELGKTELKTDTKMIILQEGEKDAAVVADCMNGVKWIMESDIHPPPPNVGGISKRWLQGVVQVESGPLMFLDVETIFDSEEIKKI